MFKWASWALRVGATALLLSFLCIWTTGYIVNSYMETVIKQLDLPLKTQPFALSGVWGKLWGAERSPDPADSSNEAASTSEASSSPSSEKLAESSPSPSDEVDSVSDEDPGNEKTSPKVEEEPVVREDAPIDAIPVFNGGTGGQTTAQLTDEQRQHLYALVVSKLDAEQLKQLSDSLQGGLSAEELSSLQTMLKNALSEDEYTQMMALLQGGENRESDAPNE